MIAEIKKRDTMIEEMARMVEEGKKTTAELIMEIDMLRRRLIIYENPHVPPSNDSVPAQQKKARSAKGSRTVRTDRRKDGWNSGPQARPYRRLPPQKIKGGSTPQAGQVQQVRRRQHLRCTHHHQADNRHTGDAKGHGRDPCVPSVCMF